MGKQEPIIELAQNRLKGHAVRPDRLLIFADRVEESKPNLVRKHSNANTDGSRDTP